MAGAADAQELNSEQAIIGRFNEMRQAVNSLWSKINDLEMESAEHDIVIKALDPMETSRKCYRMIGDVLVERTVGETLPAVKRNRDGLEGVLQKMRQQLQAQEQAVKDFQARYKIRVQGQQDEAEEQQQQQKQKQQAGGSSAQGVLV